MANSKDNINKYASNFIGFDEEIGNVFDSIGGYTGTIVDSPTRVTGWNGKGYAMEFNGTSQYVQFNAHVLSPGNKTIRFKIKTSDTVANIISVGRSANGSTNYTNGFVIGITDGKLRVGAYNTSESLTSNAVSNTLINNNVWRDILVVIKDSVANIYIDGVFDNSGSFVEPAVYSNASVAYMVLGRLNVSGYNNYLSGQLDSIEFYKTDISIIPDKYLVLHNNEYKYHEGTSWQVTTATEENFIQFGMEQLSQITESQWDELGEDVSIVMWSDFEDKNYVNVVLEKEEFTAKDLIGDEYNVIVVKNDDIEPQKLLLDAVGQPQTVYPLSDMSLFGVIDISSLSITGTGSGRIAISVDSGATWNTFDGGSWSSIADISQGMDYTTFNSLTDAQLKVLLGDSKFIRFAYYLTGDAVFENVTMKVSTEGTPEFANKDDYTMSYDMATKTITYVINKSGEYIINYNDVE